MLCFSHLRLHSWTQRHSSRRFPRLKNGEKILSRGYVPDVPVVVAGLIVQIGVTITCPLHDVDLVLGENWL